MKYRRVLTGIILNAQTNVANNNNEILEDLNLNQFSAAFLRETNHLICSGNLQKKKIIITKVVPLYKFCETTD